MDLMHTKDASAWYTCPACKGAIRQSVHTTAVLLSGEYKLSLLSVPPLLLQSLACLDTSLNVQQKYGAFADGQLHPRSLVDVPFVEAEMRRASAAVQSLLRSLLADMLAHNVIAQK